MADLLKSELGGRRCEIINITSRADLNCKACVTDEYLAGTNQYRVTMESLNEVLKMGPHNLK